MHETLEQCARREMFEEGGIPNDLNMTLIDIYYDEPGTQRGPEVTLAPRPTPSSGALAQPTSA